MSTRYRLGRLVCGRVLLITAVPGAPGSPRRLRSSPASRGTLRTVPKVAFALLIIKLIAVWWFHGWRNGPGNVHHNNKPGRDVPGHPRARLVRRQLIQKLLNYYRD